MEVSGKVARSNIRTLACTSQVQHSNSFGPALWGLVHNTGIPRAEQEQVRNYVNQNGEGIRTRRHRSEPVAPFQAAIS